MGILKKLFRKSSNQPKQENACEHDWVLEEPTHEVGISFKMWEGPLMEYCRKCGAWRRRPECDHNWKPIDDDGRGITVNGRKTKRVAIRSKCGAAKYK